jgi:hypothetical protein
VSRPTRVGIHWSDMKPPNAHPHSPLLFLSALGHADACIVLVCCASSSALLPGGVLD